MRVRPKQHVPVNDELLCGCDSFRAFTDARDACTKCARIVDDLLHALRQTANEADFTGYDKRTVRAIELAFAVYARSKEAG